MEKVGRELHPSGFFAFINTCILFPVVLTPLLLIYPFETPIPAIYSSPTTLVGSSPKELLIVMVNRNGKNITPNGATIIHTLDRLLVVSDHTEIMDNLENIFGLKNVVDDVKPKKYSIKRTLNKQRRKINIIYFNQRHKYRK